MAKSVAMLSRILAPKAVFMRKETARGWTSSEILAVLRLNRVIPERRHWGIRRRGTPEGNSATDYL